MITHVTPNEDIAKAIRRGLRLPVHFVNDNVLLGPCASDPEAHCEQRCDFWGLQGRHKTNFRLSFARLISAMKSGHQLVVWTSGLWSDRLATWALCAWRLRYRPEQPDLGIVVLGDAPDDGFSRGFVNVTPADAHLCPDNAPKLSLTRVRHMARSWRKVCGRSPLLSEKGRGRGHARKDLVELGTHQAGFFPRIQGRALLLSCFDELLFSCVHKEWSTPVDVFLHRSAAGDELRKWLTLTGDIFLAMRMRTWAEHRGTEAALERESHRPDRIMLEARYRLSDTGHAIQRHGLAEIAQGAALPIWGVVAYDPLRPWVVVNDEEGQSLRIHKP